MISSKQQPFYNSLITFTTATLASGCCWIQLLFNLFGLGCAGFAVLSPFQPYCGALCLTSIAYSIKRYCVVSKSDRI